jgi:PAS domain S-box-containing protein
MTYYRRRPSSWVVRVGAALVAFALVLGLSLVWPDFRAFLILPVIVSGWFSGLLPTLIVAALTAVGYSGIVYGAAPLTVNLVMQIISLMLVGVITDMLYRSMTVAHDQREHLSTILNNISEGVIITDEAQRVTYANPQAAHLTGWPIEQALQSPVRLVFPPAEEIASMHKTAAMIDAALTDRQGVVRYIDGEIVPYRIPDSQRRGHIIAFRDVTTRRRFEERLRSSEQNFRKALEGAPVVVAHQDENLCYTWVYNGSIYGEEAILGRTDADLIADAASRERVIALKRRVLESNTAAHEEVAIRKEDGSFAHHILYVRPAERGIMTTVVTITARKHAEEALRRNEARLQAAVENSPLTVVELDRDLRYVWVAGLPESMRHLQLVGKKQATYLLDDHLAPIQEVERRVIETGDTDRQTDVIQLPDGTMTYWDRTFLPRYDSHGDIVGITVAAVDITELKRTEARLRESEERLQTAIRNSPLTVLTFDEDLNYVWVANAHPSFDVEAALGRNVTEVIPGDAGAELALFMRQVLKTGEGQRIHLTFTLPGTSEPLTWDTTIEPIADEQGDITGLTVAAMDVTERIQLMRRVATERDKLRSVIDSVSDEIWFCDSDGNLNLVNRAVREEFQLDDMAELDLNAIIEGLEVYTEDGTPRSAEDAPLLKALQGESLTDIEEIVINPVTGQRKHRLVNATPLYDAEGTLYGAAASVRDITRHKQMEATQRALLEREREARAEAERANAIKTEFFGVISHELRTPLTSILGFADTLLAEDVTWSAAEQEDFIGVIVQEATKLEALISDLLDVSHIKSGSFTVNLGIHTVEELFSVTEANLKQLTANHRLTVTIADDLPQLEVDLFRASQVLVNLVGNAAKFAPAGTAIIITVHPTAGDAIRLSVTDEGPGIPPEERKIIFDAFRRSVTGKGKPGAGLGLAICKGIVEAHGGRIWLEDAIDGTCIAFTLPTVTR